MSDSSRAWDGLRAHWPFKLAAGSLISLCFFGLYFALQRATTSVHLMRPTAVDDWIGFHPRATPLYLSLWVYMSIVPWLATDRRWLHRYTRAVIGICAVGLACFAVWPTAVTRPSPANGSSAIYSAMVLVDGSRNACPSLHAAFAVLSALCLADATRDRPVICAIGILWGIGILYATLATKQHVVIDLIAGAPLGVAGWWHTRSAGAWR